MNSARSNSTVGRSGLPSIQENQITAQLTTKCNSRLGIILGNAAKQQLRNLDVELTNKMTRKGFEEKQ